MCLPSQGMRRAVQARAPVPSDAIGDAFSFTFGSQQSVIKS
ncbi:hypothetical protein WQQ_11920 [Hydrocarboniphaga effusa AP103]|uniref:Uncharacterized protein n=1 Tax=Hydrocarboniphaga effusa AP103 TaxID=1172194 RepID=I8TB92_9GAMM|nr:hypothetical protein WQQ_11920 [Hydrocarboniphaga effusa AP103]